MARKPWLSAFTAALLLAWTPSTASALQTAPWSSTKVDAAHDTGPVENRGDDWEVVASFPVTVPGAEWLQLEFEEVTLAGDPFAGEGALLWITSHEDGALQEQNRYTVEQWRLHSAYFNGDAVTVEVWAAPGTGASRVRLKAVEMGLPPAAPTTQCGSSDDRVLSSDPRACRIVPVGCTAWLIDDCAGCYLTAGHCMGSVGTALFNVPLSDPNGSPNFPGPNDQYPIDQTSFQFVSAGIGNDWGYFGGFPNSNTGLTAAEAQGQTYVLASPPPFNNNHDIRITGYGTDGSPATHNAVQQTHAGPWTSLSGASIGYQADTQGGNSGSPVIHEPTGNAIGIHCHGGCGGGGGSNWGTTTQNSGLQNALADPQGVCDGGMSLLTAIPVLLGPGETATVDVQIDGGVIPGSALLHVRYTGGPVIDVPLAMAAGNVFRGTLPPPTCDATVEFWFSAQTTGCQTVLLPENAPQVVFDVPVGETNPQVVFDMETSTGWTVTGTPADGDWVRVDPIGTNAQPEDDHTVAGTQCWVTGQGTPGGSDNEADVDGGTTNLLSPLLDVTGLNDPFIGYWRWYSNDQGAFRGDPFFVHVTGNDGADWTLVESVGAASGQASGGWFHHTFRVADLVTPSSQVKVRFRARDTVLESTVEAAVDDVEVFELGCSTFLPDCNQNGIVDSDDLASGRSLDLDGNGTPDECVAVGAPLCFGDGSGNACPCGNDSSTPGEGCVHSGGRGMTITGAGSTSISADDLFMVVAGAPAMNSGIFYVGRTSLDPGNPLFDGLQCAGGDVRRFGGLFNQDGSASDGGFVAQEPSGSYFVAGLSYFFQFWSRDVATGSSPCGTFANFSPAYAVTMTP